MDLTLIAVVAVALFFDFTNGFHDAANAIATSVSTRAVSPRLAVIGAALLRVRAGAGAVSPGSPQARIALGFASGTLTTSAGVNGPPIALWLTRRGLGPAEVRDSLSAAFLGLGVIGVVALVPVLDDAKLSLGLLLASAACVVAGHAVGSRAFARLEARRYEPLLLAVILAAGAASVVGGAIAAT